MRAVERFLSRCSRRNPGLTFELDLASYLDVGLFLDRRITRRFIATQAKDKDVLNLFAYTGSASVYAAAGGATSVTTVDLSQTYLDWAKRNMVRNGYGVCVSFHQGRRARVGTCGKGSAPGEGRSHSSLRSYLRRPAHLLELQSDGQARGISNAIAIFCVMSKLLRPGGIIIFSGNLRSFKLDEAALVEQGFTVRDITAKTIPEDFAQS